MIVATCACTACRIVRVWQTTSAWQVYWREWLPRLAEVNDSKNWQPHWGRA